MLSRLILTSIHHSITLLENVYQSILKHLVYPGALVGIGLFGNYYVVDEQLGEVKNNQKEMTATLDDHTKKLDGMISESFIVAKDMLFGHDLATLLQRHEGLDLT